MIRALIFDMDGLMVDTEPLYWEVERQMARGYGREVSDATLRRMMGRGRIDSITIFRDETNIPATPEALLEQRERLMLERYQAGVEPMPGLREILARFDGRLRFAVATSSPRVFADVVIARLGLQRYFEVVTSGDEITHGKPDPEIYLTTMRRLGVTPGESVVLEDSHAGAMAGHRAGAYVIAIPTELTAEQDFTFADHRAPDLFAAAEQVERIMAT